MGYSGWSTEIYEGRKEERARTGSTVFGYHTDISTGRTKKEVHAAMDPKSAVRESRDSEEHPNSLAIIVALDVTGSMRSTPKDMHKSIPELMDTIIQEGGVLDPQILTAAIGDFYSDRVPLQVGQFESGLEIEEDLGRIYMEGDGGCSYEESYEAMLYFAARKTAIDCHEKRGEKGYLFMIGDEHPYPTFTRGEAKSLFGDELQVDEIPINDLVKEVQEKYHVYFVIPGNTNHGNDPKLHAYWEKLLGSEYVIRMEHPSQINSTVARAIKARCSGKPIEASDVRNARL